MKRLLTFFLLTALSCSVLASCEHMSGPSYLGEYAGTILSTRENPSAYAGFRVDVALYDNNSCLLCTAVILEDNHTLDQVRYQTLQYGNVSEAGFDIINGSGAVLARASYCGPLNFPEGEILLSWNGEICPEWTKNAEASGWSQPCRMMYYNQNRSDTKSW